MNKLDKFCKQQDIIYSKFKDTDTRSEADKDLAKVALQRVTAEDANIGEKIAALGVAGIMTGKNKLGMGLKKRKKDQKNMMVFYDYL